MMTIKPGMIVAEIDYPLLPIRVMSEPYLWHGVEMVRVNWLPTDDSPAAYGMISTRRLTEYTGMTAQLEGGEQP